jgi:hypothetical protein
MFWQKSLKMRVAGSLALCAVLAAVAVATSPAGVCVRSQTGILIASAYSELPLRAASAAQIMCARNNNQLVRQPWASGGR